MQIPGFCVPAGALAFRRAFTCTCTLAIWDARRMADGGCFQIEHKRPVELDMRWRIERLFRGFCPKKFAIAMFTGLEVFFASSAKCFSTWLPTIDRSPPLFFSRRGHITKRIL